jgi:hypothetical protein
MLQPILTMLPWLGVYLRSHIPAVRRRAPAATPRVAAAPVAIPPAVPPMERRP